jgi:hypothetical protein
MAEYQLYCFAQSGNAYRVALTRRLDFHYLFSCQGPACSAQLKLNVFPKPASGSSC